MKKLRAALLSSAIVFPSIVGSAHAEIITTDRSASDSGASVSQEEMEKQMENAQISKDEALKKAKAFVDVPKGYEQDSIRFHSNWYANQNAAWIISWRKNDEQFYGNINVTIDANTGEVIGMDRYENNPDEEVAYPPKVNFDEAKKIARSFVEKQFPKKVEELKYDDSSEQYQKPPLRGNVTYFIKYDRVVNGIPFNRNSVNIRVNGNGEIVGFDFRWDSDIEFPETDGMISQKEAETKIVNNLPLQLTYQTHYEMPRYGPRSNEPTIQLAYSLIGATPLLDAKSGNWINHMGKEIEMADYQYEPIADKPLADPPEIDKDGLTQEEAIAIIEDHFEIPEDAELDNINYHENNNQFEQQESWRFSWRAKDNHSFYMHASVDAKTGEILNFSKDEPYYITREQQENFEANYTRKEAKETVIDFMKELFPHRIHQLAFDERRNNFSENDSQPYYHFDLNRLKNGIIAQDQHINVTVSAETGEITRFYQRWNDEVDFPSNENAISLEEAKKIYLQQYDIEAQYTMIYQPVDNNGEQPKPEIELVYLLERKPTDDAIYLDAVKGNWVYRSSGEIYGTKEDVKDIKGHWAEEQLQLMLDYNAINVDDDGLVHPDQAITRGEMIKMFMLTSHPEPYFYKTYEVAEGNASFSDVSASSEYFAYVESAVQQGLIDKTQKKFKPNELVSREEVAELVVKALNLYELSKIEKMFTVDFKDADKIENKGVAALVQHLGIINGEDGYFKPDQNITRAEAAKVYFEFLKKQNKFRR